MRSILLLFLIAPFYMLHGQECFISGTIQGAGNDTLNIFVYPCKTGEDIILDKVICHHDSFYYHAKLNLSMVHMVRIYKESWNKSYPGKLPFKPYPKQINFFISPGEKLTFKARIEDFGVQSDVFGSVLSEQQNAFCREVYFLKTSFNNHCSRYISAKKLNDSLSMKDEILEINRLSDEVVAQSINYILTHPDWDYSADVLSSLPLDSTYIYFEKLGPNAKASFFGQYVMDYLFAVKPGEPAPQFTLPDSNGKLVSLSGFKGKYIILDFWGSWCGYCMREMPEMKKYYNQYYEKAEFIGIACKDSKISWQKALAANEMNWINVFSSDEKITKTYGIKGYPSKLIINPEGIVVEKYIGSDPAFFTRLDELFGSNNR